MYRGAFGNLGWNRLVGTTFAATPSANPGDGSSAGIAGGRKKASGSIGISAEGLWWSRGIWTQQLRLC